MNLVWSALVIFATAALAVTAMLLVRRSAPEGSRFKDGDRASGVFGVLATGFSVLLGLVVFLAFESYDQSRAGAEQEALVLSQQVETAQFLAAPVSGKLTGELVCYGRSVVHLEWPRAESGTEGDEVNPWGVELFRTFNSYEPKTPSEEAAYGKWIDQTSDREARANRSHPRRRRRDPAPAVDRAAPHLRRGLRVHAVLRRLGRGRGHAGGVDGLGHDGPRVDAALDHVPGQPLSQGRRRRPAGRDGEDASNRRRSAAGCRTCAWNLPCDAQGNPVS